MRCIARGPAPSRRGPHTTARPAILYPGLRALFFEAAHGRERDELEEEVQQSLAGLSQAAPHPPTNHDASPPAPQQSEQVQQNLDETAVGTSISPAAYASLDEQGSPSRQRLLPQLPTVQRTAAPDPSCPPISPSIAPESAAPSSPEDGAPEEWSCRAADGTAASSSARRHVLHPISSQSDTFARAEADGTRSASPRGSDGRSGGALEAASTAAGRDHAEALGDQEELIDIDLGSPAGPSGAAAAAAAGEDAFGEFEAPAGPSGAAAAAAAGEDAFGEFEAPAGPSGAAAAAAAGEDAFGEFEAPAGPSGAAAAAAAGEDAFGEFEAPAGPSGAATAAAAGEDAFGEFEAPAGPSGAAAAAAAGEDAFGEFEAPAGPSGAAAAAAAGEDAFGEFEAPAGPSGAAAAAAAGEDAFGEFEAPAGPSGAATAAAAGEDAFGEFEAPASPSGAAAAAAAGEDAFGEFEAPAGLSGAAAAAAAGEDAFGESEEAESGREASAGPPALLGGGVQDLEQAGAERASEFAGFRLGAESARLIEEVRPAPAPSRPAHARPTPTGALPPRGRRRRAPPAPASAAPPPRTPPPPPVRGGPPERRRALEAIASALEPALRAAGPAASPSRGGGRHSGRPGEELAGFTGAPLARGWSRRQRGGPEALAPETTRLWLAAARGPPFFPRPDD
eukprot:tig00001477_g8892.t1